MPLITPKNFSLIVAFLFSFLGFAQISKELNSQELLVKAYQSLEEGDTNSAYEYFHSIHTNDTNYTLALIFEIDLLENQGKNERRVELSKKGLAVADEQEVNFYISLGNAQLALEEYDNALETYTKGIEKYPYSHILNYNKALAYKNLNKYGEYVAYLQKAVSLYPFFASAHIELGAVALNKGRISQALMSYTMAILVDPNSVESNQVLGFINEAVTEKPEIEEGGYSFPEGVDDFSEIDNIIFNYVALQKKYKVESKADLPIIRQLQVLMETMEYEAADEGYWMQTYVPFYRKLWKEDMFEPFSYYLLKASRNDKHQRLVKRKASKLSEFAEWGGTEIRSYFNTIPVEVRGKKIITKRLYHKGESGLSNLGDFTENQRRGYWYFFNKSGSIYGEGEYDGNGLQTGLWKWYNEKGNLVRSYTMKEGELNGTFTDYFEDGNIDERIEFKNDMRNGSSKDYYRNGGLFSNQQYKDNKLVGKMLYYHKNGVIQYTFSRNEEEKLHGTFKQYYPNQQLKEIVSYNEGSIDSMGTSYYANGQIQSRFDYKNGKGDGPYLEYFPNGEIERKGTYSEGTVVGENVDYFSNGKLYQKSIYDVDGKLTGLLQEFDKDGVKFKEFDYKKGNIVAYRYYDKQGNIIQQAEKKFGEFEFKGYYPDGTILSQGTYDSKGGKEGEWKFYGKNGTIETDAFYISNDPSGTRKEFFVNGALNYRENYEEGVWQGVAKSYYQNGQLHVESVGEDGKIVRGQIVYSRFGDTLESRFYFLGNRHGWQSVYAVNGQLESKHQYEYGTLVKSVFFDSTETAFDTVSFSDSLVQYFYPNGQLRFTCGLRGGAKDGAATWYYPNGEIMTKGYYINNLKDGEWLSYYLNGQLKRSSAYLLDDQHGEVKEYHQNGKLSETYTYAYGVLEGENISYGENGKKTVTYRYSMGFKQGKAEFYSADGVLDHIRFYHYGKIIGYSYLGKDGKEVDMIPIENETATVKSYFQNGKVSRTYQIKNGQFDGEYKKYYSNGALYSKSTNKDGWDIGERVTYYKNGKLKNTYFYRDGLVDGKAMRYYENGKIKQELSYLKGNSHGECKNYSRSGTLTRIEYYYNNDMIEVKEM